MVEILKEITTYEIIEKTTGLTCYTYQQANKKYRLHFFCYVFDNQDELLANYEEINDQIAYSFQSQLKRKIERWNIYFFLFVKAKVAKPIKASIEQDKYATRKVIVDNFREFASLNELSFIDLLRILAFKLGTQIIFSTHNRQFFDLCQRKLDANYHNASFIEMNYTENQL